MAPHQETHPLSSAESGSAANSPPRDESDGAEAFERFVAFLLEGNHYCIPAESVLEVVHPLQVACLPNSPSVVLGIAAFRGDVVAVVNIKQALGLTETVTNSKTKHVVLRHGVTETQFLVPVDAMREIISADQGATVSDKSNGSVGLNRTVEHESVAYTVISRDFLNQVVERSIG